MDEEKIKEILEENAKLKEEIDRQERPACFHISSFTTSNTKEEVEKVRPS